MSETKSETAKKLESSTEHTKKVVEAAAEAGKAVGETVKKHAQNVMETGRAHLGAAAKDLSDAATAKYEEIRNQARQTADEYRQRAVNFQGDVEAYIRENPLK
ncbi:MAG: hypothetical protein N2322_01580, partial [Terrimicrobiaceae bacterium]|nr:hypothetical protein [Terrimicrobiaceae bacterium]